MTNLVGFFIRRYVFAISVFFALVVFGVLSYFTIGVELLPNFELTYVSASTTYTGAGATEVSTQISEPIEDAIATLPGINNIFSDSYEGLSIVTVEFVAGTDQDQAAVDVSQRINAILGSLPTDAGTPTVQKFDPNDVPIMNVALSAPGEDIQVMQRYARDELEPIIQRISGVADVSIVGEIDREIQVLLDRGKLERYNLTPQQLANVISQHSSEIPLGYLSVGQERIALSGRNTFTDPTQLDELVIDSESGLQLSGVAIVRDSSAEVASYSRVNGEPAVLLEVQKQAGTNSVAIAQRIRQTLFGGSTVSSSEEAEVVLAQQQARQAQAPPIWQQQLSTVLSQAVPLVWFQLRPEPEVPEAVEEPPTPVAQAGDLRLPDGYSVRIVADSTPSIATTVISTQRELVRAMFIVAFTVLIFLGLLGSTLSVVLAIPISLAGALIIVSALGFTFNIVTLMAVTVAVGLVVDDSVVISEAVDRAVAMGMPRAQAARLGASEVSVAVLASTLSLLAVLIPISLLPGIIGQFFREFGLTLTATIVCSYLEAMFFLTVRLAYLPNPMLPNWGDWLRSLGKLLISIVDVRIIFRRYARLWIWLTFIIVAAVNFATLYGLGFYRGGAWDGAIYQVLHRTATLLPLEQMGIVPAESYSADTALILMALSSLLVAAPVLLIPLISGYVWRLIIRFVRVPLYLVGALLYTLYAFIDVLVKGVRVVYGRVLGALLHVPWLSLLLAIGLCASLAVPIRQGRISFDFAPQSDEAIVRLTSQLPTGTDLSITNAVAQRLEAFFKTKPEVQTILTSVGLNTGDSANTAATNRIELTLELVPAAQRSYSDFQLAEQYSTEAKQLLADTPEAKITSKSGGGGGPPEEIDYELVLEGNDIDVLRRKDVIARQFLEDVPYLSAVGSNFDTTVSERVFFVSSANLQGTGLSIQDVYSTLRAYNIGLDAADLRDSGEKIPIIIKMDPSYTRDQQALLSLPIYAPALGSFITFNELGSFRAQEAPNSILRINQSYVANITADALQDAPPKSRLAPEIREELVARDIFIDGVAEGDAASLDLTGDLARYAPIAFAVALFLSYLVIASQFNSFSIPIYLLLTVPLAMVGAIWMFALTGTPLDVNSVLGMVILVGMVTKPAILLLDVVINQEGGSDLPLRDQLVRAAKLRLRPILMTTLTLIGVSLPLLLSSSAGSEFRRPLGLVIFAGVTCSAVLTLFVIPSIFYLFERRRYEKVKT